MKAQINDEALSKGKEMPAGLRFQDATASSQGEAHDGHDAQEHERKTLLDVPVKEAISTAFQAKNAAPSHAYRIHSESKLRRYSRFIVEDKWFVALTTLLTICALVGDDFRLMLTQAPADKWFDVIVITCLVIFAFEVILSCFGKDDYFLGFFFTLDVISTVSLVLDLSAVSNILNGGTDEDDQMSSLRGGRTARVGAKAGRIVRVIRLVRILKIYKAIYEARARKKALQERAERKAAGHHDDDDWDDVEIEEKEPKVGEESRVGKKLSEMTTRRVIILVLTMLLVLPLLKPEDADNASSGQYGMETVWTAFQDYLGNSSLYADYEDELLNFVYYHNWFAQGTCQNCADSYRNHVFWIGVMGKNPDEVQRIAGRGKLSEAAVKEWEQAHKNQDDMYNYGTMPEEAQALLSSPWDIRCDTKKNARLGVSLLLNEIPGVSAGGIDCPDKLRIVERKTFRPRLLTFDQLNQWHLCLYFDLRPFVRMDAGYNLLITLFVCLVLCVASLYFSSDANQLVLTPVEIMIKRVEAIRDNPLIAMKMADAEFISEEKKKAAEKKITNTMHDSLKVLTDMVTCQGSKKKVSEPMETVILEKTIIKLGSLLALGFGEAGANIIGHNMKGSDSAGVNAMIPGVRVECIMGIARIRDFGTATEVLQAKIMTFVNQIAEIVHGVVDEYAGAANKNNGDTFLIVWQEPKGMKEAKRKKLADMSIIAFTKVVGAIHRSPVLASYRGHPGLQMRLGTGCRVKLTCGLHCGWAIEGAVGSEFKIDASYVSPNVNVADSLERVTSIYQVPIVIAQPVVDLCSDNMASKLRLFENAIITGSVRPIQLYSMDLDYLQVTIDESRPLKLTWNSRQRFKARQYLETEKSSKWHEDVEIVNMFDNDPVINMMRWRYTVEFFQLFNMGYQNYSQGEWAAARRWLEHTKLMLGNNIEDGPSSAILRFMQEKQFVAPRDWSGIRGLHHLTSRN
mmetsp:Transcript_68159/g.124354  ORF Transcript_68159/g.124354 Transcript_68159/m.124354 type:complete len:966 (+) Transcript_68159:3-2900(+)